MAMITAKSKNQWPEQKSGAKCFSQQVSHHLLKRSAQVCSALLVQTAVWWGQWAGIQQQRRKEVGGARDGHKIVSLEGWVVPRRQLSRLYDGLAGLDSPFLGERHRRETPRQGYTTTTSHRRKPLELLHAVIIHRTMHERGVSRAHVCRQ